MDVVEILIADIRRDPDQVRKIFNSEALDGLAQSVKEVGLLHPVLVKQTKTGYKLVAGERRLEAAKRLGYVTIAAIVLSPGIQVKQVQLIENLQREDLNPVERAFAVKEFMDMENLTKVAAAKKLGVPRTTLTDWLDVLGIEERYQRAVVDNFNGGDSALTLSHIAEARALATRLSSPAMCNVLLNAAIEYRLSKVETREICALVRNNANVTVDDAVRAVRRPADVSKLAKETVDDRAAVEKNIEQWVAILERSNDTLNQLGRISPQYLDEEERVRITEHLKEMRSRVNEALGHMSTGASFSTQQVS